MSLSFVVSHPCREKTSSWMGHPGLVSDNLHGRSIEFAVLRLEIGTLKNGRMGWCSRLRM